MKHLEEIAKNYHLQGGYPDMFIEAICQKYEINWLKEHISFSSKVLDLGLGDGLFLEAFHDHPDFTILEGSELLAEFGTKKVETQRWHPKVIHTFFENFEPSEQFDVIIASHVLEHVSNPQQILDLCQKWLKVKGKLIVIVPNRESLHRRLGVQMGLQKELDDLSARDLAVGHLRVYSLATLSEQIEKAGYCITQERGFFTKSLANSQMLHLSPEVIYGLCELSSTLPASMGANIGLVAEKR